MADRQQYINWLVNNQDKQGSREYRTVTAAYRRQFGERAPTITDPTLKEARQTADKGVVDFPAYFMGTKTGRFIQGVSDFPIGAIQLLSNVTGIGDDTVNELVKRREQTIGSGREATGSEGLDIARLAGGVLAGGIATRGVPVAQTVIGRAAQGSAMGAGFGAVTPVASDDFARQKLTQIGLGAAAGGAVPLAVAGAGAAYRGVRNLADPFLPGGLERGAARAVRATVDDTAQAAERLRQGGTTQQGIARTGEPRLAALAEGISPRAARQTAEGIRAENLARIQAIRDAGGAQAGQNLDEVLSLASKARSEATGPLYRQAKNATTPVDAVSTVRVIERLIRQDPRNTGLTRVLGEVRNSLLEDYPAQQRGATAWSAVKQAITRVEARTGKVPSSLAEARRLLNRVKNGDLDPFEAAQSIRSLKPENRIAQEALDGARYTLEVGDKVISEDPRILISAYQNIGNLFKDPQTGKALPENIARNLSLARRSLERQIEKSVPEFKQANTLYRELSIPVNRAQIAARLEEKLAPTLAGEEGSMLAQKASTFAGALADESRLIKQATGFARGKGLDKYFKPDQLAKLENVAARLQQDAEFKAMATLGREGARRVVGEMAPDTLVNPLQRVIMVINGIIRRAGTSRVEATLDRAAQIMQDPKALADLMERATVAERAQINRLIDSPAFAATAGIAAAQGAQ